MRINRKRLKALLRTHRALQTFQAGVNPNVGFFILTEKNSGERQGDLPAQKILAEGLFAACGQTFAHLKRGEIAAVARERALFDQRKKAFNPTRFALAIQFLEEVVVFRCDDGETQQLAQAGGLEKVFAQIV